MSAEAVPELKTAAQLADEIQGKTEEEPLSEDPKDSKTYTFDFSHKDSRGKVWSGKFTNQILTIGQRRTAKVVKARLSGNVPITALDADVWTLNEMLAHMSISLTKRPDWAKNLEALYDEAIIDALYGEVASHEATFHRRDEDPAKSEESESDGTG